MRLSKNILPAFLAVSVIAGAASCKEANQKPSKIEESNFPSDVETLNTSLNLRLTEFQNTFESGQISALFDFVPPRALDKILRGSGVTRAQLDAQMDVMWAQTLETVEVGSFELDQNSTTINFLDTGRPYKILPTSTLMTIRATGSEIVSKSETLALMESSEWYIVRLDDPAQIKMFRDSYPEFDDVEVMSPITTMDGEEIKL